MSRLMQQLYELEESVKAEHIDTDAFREEAIEHLLKNWVAENAVIKCNCDSSPVYCRCTQKVVSVVNLLDFIGNHSSMFRFSNKKY